VAAAKKDSSRPEGEFLNGSAVGERPKEYYHTEKFGSNLLMNSDSHSAIAKGGEMPTNAEGNQFYVGEMSINGEYVKRMTSEDAANLYQPALTPSIMSSHSNKRQSHHLHIYNA
jgi:hypothetical protein